MFCCIITLYSVEIKESSDFLEKGWKNMKNMKIRQALMEVGMKNYQLAELMGISEFTLSRRLRKELPESEQDRILALIRERKGN